MSIAIRTAPPHLSTPIRFSLVLLIALAAGCSAHPRGVTPVTHSGKAIPFATTGSLLQQLAAANDGYGTMLSTHRVAIEVAVAANRSEKRTFQGLLAIRRPGHFRLHILGPMGVKLFDLLYAVGKISTLYVAPELMQTSILPSIIDSIAADIAAIYRLDPKPRLEERRLEESLSLASGRAPLYLLTEGGEGSLRREMTIFAATLAIARVEVVDGRGDIRTITYGNYERHGELLVPRSIHLSMEGKFFYWISIRVESLTLDGELDTQLFVAP